MKFYLSSYKLGDEKEKLKQMIEQTSGKFGHIPNARDFTKQDTTNTTKHLTEDMDDIRALGTDIELLDLKKYFGKENELRQKLSTLGGVYVSGGNTFILRQAMRLSDMDTILLEMAGRNDFIYAGYSAAGCVLASTMKPYAITDNATDMPYKEITKPIWEGLGILPFVFQPHYHSDHPESARTDKEIEYCIENKILFKAYRDGEVLLIE